MKTRSIPIVYDNEISQVSKDFNLKLTQDVIALLNRSMEIMGVAIGAQESINIILSVLALTGVNTAMGVSADKFTFAKYATIAEQAMRDHERRAVRR